MECVWLTSRSTGRQKRTAFAPLRWRFGAGYLSVMCKDEAMSELIDELRQHALMCANDIQNSDPDSDASRVAYARVKTFEGINCPKCWVCEQRTIELVIQAHSTNTDFYQCGKCGFSGVFPRVG